MASSRPPAGRFSLAALAAAALVLGAGVAHADPATQVAAATPATAVDASAVAPAQSKVASTYRLGPGDKLHVTVFNEAGLTGDYSVSDVGDISLPLAGHMHVQGMTVGEFETLLRERLGQSLQRPDLAAEVLTYRPFYILGEVQKPGQYPYASGITVLGAVATAGGFTYRANERNVFVRHSGAQSEDRIPANSAIEVMPGDTIRVQERWF